MSSPSPKLKLFSPLSWPSSVPTKSIQCAGDSFFHYKARSAKILPFLPPHLANKKHVAASTSGGLDDTDKDSSNDTTGGICLNSTRDPSQYNHYEILSVSSTATTSEIRQAYHKACLTYHPDKSQPVPEDSDSPFLLVKAAFECLSDPAKKKAYDSSLPFDEFIPDGKEPEEEFYSVYGPVFRRNLRFANKTKKFKTPPDFGDDAMALRDVHRFYEYWTNFESWRDFSLVASEELKHDVDTADCREEKRWMQKEIDRRAKALKREEMSRINLLVERALNADPRLRREKERERKEKERKEREKREKKEKIEREEREERERKETEERERVEREKEEKAKAKAQRDKEKMAMRKARQQIRKLTLSSFKNDDQRTWTDLEQMNDDVEFLCQHLTAVQLDELSNLLLSAPENTKTTSSALARIKDTARKRQKQASDDAAALAAQKQLKQKQLKQKQKKGKNATTDGAGGGAKSRPWTKDELSTLAKAIKKFPPGGANRWDTISNFINNSLQLSQPRTKEECIVQYNAFANAAPPSSASTAGGGGGGGGASRASSTVTAASNDASDWSEEQDRQLQEGLKKYPAKMEKNERWTAIAKGVTGKGKKDCVQRFKAIREALKSGKSAK